MAYSNRDAPVNTIEKRQLRRKYVICRECWMDVASLKRDYKVIVKKKNVCTNRYFLMKDTLRMGGVYKEQIYLNTYIYIYTYEYVYYFIYIDTCMLKWGARK